MTPTGPVQVLAVGFDPGTLPDAEVEPAADLLGALAHLADGGVEVVLLSLELPEGAEEAVRAVRERAPTVPVIAVGGEPGDAERAIDAGASDVLPADPDPELLRRAVRYATSIQRMEAELRRRQVVDDHTGLYNARGFEQLASHHLRMADRSRQPVVLVFVRLDGLEGAGDAGHVAETAAVLRSAVRDSDVIARIGTGAFCVLLTGDATGAEGLVLSRLVEAVAVRNAEGGAHAQLSLSVGAASYDPEQPVGLDELIAEADRRMGEATP